MFRNTNIHNPFIYSKKNLNHFIEISGTEKLEKYKIYNILGSEITSGTLSSDKRLNISNLTSGIYFLKLESQKKLKFIVK